MVPLWAQAATVWGRPRLTADIDVTVRLEPEDPERLVRTLETRGFALRVGDAGDFSRRTRVFPLERVRRTGRRLLVTKRGTPIAEVVPATVERRAGGWLGSASGTGRLTGDVVAPVVDADEWEAAR